MRYSNLYEIPTAQDTVSVFAGYDHNLCIADGEFYDMENLTSDFYPCLSPRGKRGVYSYDNNTPSDVKGIIAKDNLCWVEGAKFYVNGNDVDLGLSVGEKQLISMGAYVIIMPDKKWINTLNTAEHGDIDSSWTYATEAPEECIVTYSLCDADGNDYSGYTQSTSAPESPEDGAMWLDTSSTPHMLKKWTAVETSWIAIPSTYIKISAPGIGADFERYDGVMLNGVEPEQLADLNGQTSILYVVHHDSEVPLNDYIVVTGIIDNEVTQDMSSTQLVVSRNMPAMDFVIESGNRLWGCRYGTNNAGEVVNEIYASKLGDFKNWFCYMGVSTDSYAASVGTDGYFTGAITYLGYPIFFKENCMHKVYGSFPSNYQIQTTACRGIQKGAGKSLAIVNEKLYYKGRNGVCVYDGSLPVEAAEAFGSIHYSGVDDLGDDPLRNGAVAGGHDNKYYISMKSEVDGNWYFFVLDTTLGTWHKEDNFRAVQFASCKGEIYAIDASDGKLVTFLGSGTQSAQSVKWHAETGVLGITTRDRMNRASVIPEKKYISKLVIRMSLAVGARVRFSVQYDSHGDWEHMATTVGTTLKSFSVSLKPRRCDHFRLRIDGVGEAKIYSISKTLERGSDV